MHHRQDLTSFFYRKNVIFFVGSSTCDGDSGGGMYFDDNGTYRLRGIVSLAKTRNGVEKYCDPHEYIVFTDAARYLDWIRNNL